VDEHLQYIRAAVRQRSVGIVVSNGNATVFMSGLCVFVSQGMR